MDSLVKDMITLTTYFLIYFPLLNGISILDICLFCAHRHQY